MFIYKITNLINNKVYIGQTTQKNPMMRWYRHTSNAKLGMVGFLYNSIRKHGVENFKFKILCCCFNIESSNILEEYFIELYESNNRKFGYNILAGGKNRRHTEESNLKNRLSHLGKINSQETRLKLSKANKGRSPWNKGVSGYSMPSSQPINLSKALSGKPKSFLHKQNLSLAKIEYYKHNEHPFSKPIVCLNTGRVYKSIQDAADEYNCKNAHIARVCRKERKAFKGFKFEFVNKENIK